MTSKKYNVVTMDNGVSSGILTHRDKTSWTLRTAKKYADEFKAKHGKECIVIPDDEPFFSAIAVYDTSRKCST